MLILAILFTLIGCGSREEDLVETPKDEYITWKLNGTQYQNGTIYKSIVAGDFEISEEGQRLYLEVQYSGNVSVGQTFTNQNSIVKLGYEYPDPANDIKFSTASVTITAITSTYIEGTFTGSNAKEVTPSGVETPINKTITEGKFLIKK